VHVPGSAVGRRGLVLLRKAGSTQVARVRAVVVVEVHEARPLVSPPYDDGVLTEEEIVSKYRERFARLHGAIAVARGSGQPISRPG